MVCFRYCSSPFAFAFVERLCHYLRVACTFVCILWLIVLDQARDDALLLLRERSRLVDEGNRAEMLSVVKASIGTKFVSRWSDLMTGLALDAVRTVSVIRADGSREIDIKRFVRIEKIPGAEMTDSRVIRGVVLNKDIVHAQMRRKIVNPRVILLDTGIEYKKGENQVCCGMSFVCRSGVFVNARSVIWIVVVVDVVCLFRQWWRP